MIKPMIVETVDNFIQFRYIGDDDITYQTQKNLFREQTGLTIQNPDINIPVYGITLSNWGTHIDCGHIIDNVIGFLKGNDLENIVLVVDFSDVIEVSESFCEQYLKFILSTKSKVLSIHQNTNITNALSLYIEGVIEYQDVET